MSRCCDCGEPIFGAAICYGCEERIRRYWAEQDQTELEWNAQMQAAIDRGEDPWSGK